MATTIPYDYEQVKNLRGTERYYARLTYLAWLEQERIKDKKKLQKQYSKIYRENHLKKRNRDVKPNCSQQAVESKAGKKF